MRRRVGARGSGLALDQHATAAGADPASVTLTGVAADAVIVVCIGANNFTGTPNPFTVESVTAPGLTFAERASTGIDDPNTLNYLLASTWWAPTSSAGDYTLDVAFSPGAFIGGNETALVAFSVVGAELTDPWDTPAATAVSYYVPGTTVPDITQPFTTINADTFAFHMAATLEMSANWNLPGLQQPPSMSFLDGLNTGQEIIGVAYQILSAPWTAQPVGWGPGGYNQQPYNFIADALVPAGGGGGGTDPPPIVTTGVGWNRTLVAEALVSILGAATGVTVHPYPPDVLNPMCIVIGRPQPVTYGVAALGVDEAVLPVIIVGGLETENAVEELKDACRAAILADQSLNGAVLAAWPTEERNWRNVTGAGGIQLLTVELVLTVQM